MRSASKGNWYVRTQSQVDCNQGNCAFQGSSFLCGDSCVSITGTIGDTKAFKVRLISNTPVKLHVISCAVIFLWILCLSDWNHPFVGHSRCLAEDFELFKVSKSFYLRDLSVTCCHTIVAQPQLQLRHFCVFQWWNIWIFLLKQYCLPNLGHPS